MDGKTGNRKLLEQLIADGIEYIFGNPGTVEQGFLNELKNYPQLKYILTLQESIAVMAADGYARSTKKPTVVQLHSSPGIGNAVGAVYQAYRGHSPLVIIAGDAGVKYMNMDAQMAADLTGIMKPVTKYSTMVLHKDSVLRTLRRAVKIASTPPMGPVYVCLPADILDEINTEQVFPSASVIKTAPADDGVCAEIAASLVCAETPVFFIGDGVAYCGAEEAVKELAELIGAEVYGADCGELNMDNTSPCWKGMTGHMFGFASLPVTMKADAALILGTYMLPEVFPETGEIFNASAKVMHIDLNDYEIAKNHRVDTAVSADIGLTLKKVTALIKENASEADRKRFRSRFETLANTVKSPDFPELEKDAPLKMHEFAKVLKEKIPADTVIFDEALTSSPELTAFIVPKDRGTYFQTRGGSLGVGFPGAIGIKTANPEKTVIGFSGDGGCLYTIQALWTAAHHGIGAKFVVCNNMSYKLLKLNISQYWREQAMENEIFPECFSIDSPAVDFVSIARGFGVDALRVERREDIAGAIDAMLSTDKPFLIDLSVDTDHKNHQAGCRCGQ
ncbi:thiamine pyrophosphate-binding protein [Seleniivibrio woodruffii]|uniref:Benzoylformate decarboxylase n=1 Tax=Seleniivibrio woodruffii TaxID=1078050 RepID=A0A4R1K6T0_9BACT|nr:thiamine pyrophosphate-binding protein [Seleniivibrio woodruffii]TCK59914.1 benzoylformate decarboxylase [Seleniivibrio woodruffii]TVZ35865.1 benzoylformate decarboxylase [Seleniivibrio woodruffii]